MQMMHIIDSFGTNLRVLITVCSLKNEENYFQIGIKGPLVVNIMLVKSAKFMVYKHDLKDNADYCDMES